MQHRDGIYQAVQDQAISLSSALRVSSSTSHFFRIAKIVFAPNPARINCRKIRAACLLILGLYQPLRLRYSRACFSSLTSSKPHPRPCRSPRRARLLSSIRDHPPPPKFLVVPPQRRKRRGILRVVQVALILQPPDDQFDQRLAIFGFGISTRARIRRFSSATVRMRRPSAPTAYS